jgi:hypothetical protein
MALRSFQSSFHSSPSAPAKPEPALEHGLGVKRADLHCHSVASTEADEAVLLAIGCPECFSEPTQVYAQAKRRGMDFITITDHDSINGVLQLAGSDGELPADILVGEELTCYFPEDRCKMHVLVWGISKADHDALLARADDLYAVAEYIESRRIAHAVAHPLYRQNDKLERWHMERLILLFKGFETLNGAHSLLHRQSLEPMLDELTPRRVTELSEKHKLAARWPEPWKKSRTAGSDDHGLLNIGRTWTEFPSDATTVGALLDCIREGRCRPGGEAGSSLKLAHNFFSVAIRYHGRKLSKPGSRPAMTATLFQTLVGDRPAPRKRDLVKLVVADRLRSAGRVVGQGIMRPFSRLSRRAGAKPGRAGTTLLGDLLIDSFKARAGSFAPLLAGMKNGEAPLAQHETIFSLISALNRDITGGILSSVQSGLADGHIASVFDALSAVAAHQFALMPYYFSLFHQNQERHLLPCITGHGRKLDAASLRVGVFTDSSGARSNGSGNGGRFLQGLARHVAATGRSLCIHTCGEDATIIETSDPSFARHVRNFRPLVEQHLPAPLTAPLRIPPVAEVLEWADRQQFDAIHIDTPGPMGLCGWLASKMLRVPLLATHNFDPAAEVYRLTSDYRLTATTRSYVQWLYGQTTGVFVWGRDGRESAVAAGVASGKITLLPPDIDTGTQDESDDDELHRLRANRTSSQRSARLSRGDGFDAFWDKLVAAAEAARAANSLGRDAFAGRAANPGSPFDTDRATLEGAV